MPDFGKIKVFNSKPLVRQMIGFLMEILGMAMVLKGIDETAVDLETGGK